MLPALLLALLPGGAAMAGTVTVTIDNVRNAIGRVHVDLCPEARFLKVDCPYAGEATAREGVTQVRIGGVAPGRYAAQVSHDENGNHKVDRGLFGIPTEGIGFSNDAPIRLGPPRFADAAFEVTAADQAIRVRLRYFTGARGPAARR